MPHYRIYWFNASNHIYGAENVECATDRDAAIMAESLVGFSSALEVWSGTRRVARLRAILGEGDRRAAVLEQED
jgi:hypothetical protein